MGSESPRTVGERIGPYELVSRLGEGAMGQVWEAILHGPEGFRKAVALKLLHAAPSRLERALLVREARLGARLQHPNVVSVLGLGEHDGHWYVVMELVRGRSVGQLVDAGEVDPALILDIGCQVSAGLAHVHGLVVDDRPAGLVHCDIKPQNLLLDEHGIVKIADLGIAALTGDRMARGGTLGFMAPEQTDGAPEARSDLFALGATLYMLATGRLPFEPSLRGLFLLERRLADPAFVDPLDARVPGLGAVVSRCLRAEPADRFDDARALGLALARLRTPGVALASRPSAPPLAPSSTRALSSVAPTVVVSLEVASRATSGLGNLPRPRDRFVGRAAERAAVAGLLRGGERLVTMWAMGGTGKTRLALEVALEVAPDFVGGAFRVELASARAADEVCAAVANQLGSALAAGEPAAQVGAILAGRGSALFLLDNLEPAIEAVRTLLPQWMEAAPAAQFLATSRAPLKLRGERPVPLEPLSPPEAVALFEDRAPVPIPAEHAPEVIALCEALEGVPLAVELAAARLRTMSVPQVRQRLGLKLLSGGSAELPDRHRSLEASIRWSWDLLSPRARAALSQLAGFVGGCTLAAAEAVLDESALGADGWALDAITALCEASLARIDPTTDRVVLAAAVRAFVVAQAPEADRLATADRHAAFFAQLGAPGVSDRVRIGTLSPDRDNLLAAGRHVIARPLPALVGPLTLAAIQLFDLVGPYAVVLELAGAALAVPAVTPADRARIAGSAARAALVTGHTADADRFLGIAAEAVAAAGSPPQVRGVLLGTEALRHRLAGRLDQAEAACTEAIALLEPLGDPLPLARVVSGRGGLCHEQGRDQEAVACFTRSLALRRAAGDRHGEAMDRANLGNVAMALGRHGEALTHQQSALARYRELGDARGEAQTTGDLGLSLQEVGRPAEAEDHFRAALSMHRRAGNRRFEGIVSSNLGRLLTRLGRLPEARVTLQAALELHRAVGNRRSEGIALQSLASVERQAGHLVHAERLVGESIAVHVSTRNRRFEADAHDLHAKILEALDRPTAALAALDRSIAAFAALGTPDRPDGHPERRAALAARSR